MHSYEARAIYKSREAGSGDSRRATARVPTPLHTTPALTRLCWRMRLRGDSHPPAGRPRGSPLLWTGLESRFPRGVVGATLVVARLDRSMLLSFCIPSVIRQQSLTMISGESRSVRHHSLIITHIFRGRCNSSQRPGRRDPINRVPTPWPSLCSAQDVGNGKPLERGGSPERIFMVSLI